MYSFNVNLYKLDFNSFAIKNCETGFANSVYNIIVVLNSQCQNYHHNFILLHVITIINQKATAGKNNSLMHTHI